MSAVKALSGFLAPMQQWIHLLSQPAAKVCCCRLSISLPCYMSLTPPRSRVEPGLRPTESASVDDTLGSQKRPFDCTSSTPADDVTPQRPEPTPKRAFEYLKMTRSRGLPEKTMVRFATILRSIKTEELTVTEMMDQVADLFEVRCCSWRGSLARVINLSRCRCARVTKT